MLLSIVIVNYNVKYFLERALQSIFQSSTNFDYEVFVVDNHSVDGSIEMVAEQFPKVHLIASKINLGFSKGNNLAIKEAVGKYILLLNPDTIVKEDTFQKVIDYMESNEKAGGLGVKMMDGNGHFLPESKRGFPTPFVAFSKMSGLSKLFPKSKKFNQYHLGYLDKDKIHEVDVLSGAFMLLRTSVIDEIGSLDESFFMYGEDIDLSYRIKQAGFKNIYFPDTEIIHFKGESTKKGSFNYVRMFYNAMIIFAKKHFKGSKAKYLTTLLTFAIYIRASFAFVRRSIERIAWPFVDTILIFLALFGLKSIWPLYIKEGIQFPESYLAINIPLYIAIWLLAFFFRGGYEYNSSLKSIFPGISIGTIIILATYALLPEHLRSSRGMIILGALIATGVLLVSRLSYYGLRGELNNLFQKKNRLLVIASDKESKRIIDIINNAELNKEIIGIANNISEHSVSNYLGNIEDVVEIVKVHRIDEIIFSLSDISNHEVMKIMSALGGKIQYKIISEGSDVIIGSNSKDSAGDLYTLDINFNLNQPHYRRTKQLSDFLGAIALLIASPILIFIVNKKATFFRNIFQVLFGQKTWVGYPENEEGLPMVKKSVLTVVDTTDQLKLSKASIAYAKNYNWSNDINCIVKQLKNLGN